MNIELVDLIVPAGSLLAGYLAGVVRTRRKKPRPPRAPQPVSPICPCGHAVSFHEGGAGICHGQAKNPTKFDVYGDVIAYDLVPCTCQVYAGPEVISSITMQPTTYREIAAPEDT